MSQPFSIDCTGHKITLTMINDDDSFTALDITMPALSAVMELLLKSEKEQAVLERDDGKESKVFLLKVFEGREVILQ